MSILAFEQIFKTIRKQENPADGLVSLNQFAERWPELVEDPNIVFMKLELLVKMSRTSDVKALSKRLVARAITHNDIDGLRKVAATLRKFGPKGDPELTPLLIEAAEAAGAIDDKDPEAALALLETYRFTDNEAKLKEIGARLLATLQASIGSDTDVLGLLRLAAAQFALGEKMLAKATAEN